MNALSAPGRLSRRHRPDYGLIICVGVLLVLGLVIIYSISPVLSHKLLGDVGRNYYLYGQLLHVSVGLGAFLLTSNLHYRRWQRWLPALVVVAGLALLLLMLPGISVSKNGATRWLNLGPLSFQPAELVKLTLVVGLANYFSRLSAIDLRDYRRSLWPMAALLGVLAILIVFLQRDLGTMVVVATIIFGVFFMSGVDIAQLGILLGMGAGVGVLSIALFPHRIARILTFFNPAQDVSSSGYHLNQALIAVGSGGLLGLGIGKSIQIYGYLPEAANDSIFAIIGETFGLIGAIAVLAVFVVLIYRGLQVARRAPNRFAQLLVVGVVLWVASQAAVNILAMIGLVPLTGIPLPFLSYGGTSLIMMMAAIGIVVNVSKYTERGNYADSTLRRGDGRSHDPTAGYRRRPEAV